MLQNTGYNSAPGKVYRPHICAIFLHNIKILVLLSNGKGVGGIADEKWIMLVQFRTLFATIFMDVSHRFVKFMSQGSKQTVPLSSSMVRSWIWVFRLKSQSQPYYVIFSMKKISMKMTISYPEDKVCSSLL
ncbi:hypothetical protein AVEN_162242-1 [Araneus ventricosus]|uniref:Uncharacterized protein n=1 Tax=Araneus ventricosus TaxID=182803 RepID=A0A4Y2SL39_ARAVE|nr:hypothetical protein AVEN_162242-1 [Araneus ventricosus]